LEQGGSWFYSRAREKRNSFGGSELRPKTEREERKMVFHIAISIRDWRVIYGPILMKFQYVVSDDEGYALTGVDRWTSSPVARLFIPTW
jgi:hypothetical protein